MLTVHNLNKSYGIEPVLINISFSLNAGDRIGLVGPNGCGKTTLLRLIAGQEQPDSGQIHFNPPDLPLGYLPQGAEFQPDETIAGYLARTAEDIAALSATLEELAQMLAKHPERNDLQQAYDAVLVRIEHASELSADKPATLDTLGLDQLPAEMPVSSLSGGQKTRLALAGLLLRYPRLLLLDEPTNHLDLTMLAWLETWLDSFRGAVLMVSHDRAFLDHTATGILEISGHTHHSRFFPGNYTDYLEQKLNEREHQWQAYRDQQDEIHRLRSAADAMRSKAKFRKGGKADSGDKFAAGFFANRSKETLQKAKNIEKRIQSLLTTEHIERPERSWEMKIDFPGELSSGRDVVVLESVSAGYRENTLLEDLNLTLRFGSRTALIGPNGCGKTTLLRTISGEIEPLAGRLRLGSGVQLGFMSQEQENLNAELNPLETLQQITGKPETEIRSFLSLYLFKGDDVFTPVQLLSYGERARLMLAALVAQGCNLLLLDEPVNHLDIPARTQFEQALGTFQGTILAVVHDRYFLRNFARELWQVSGRTIRRIDLSFGEFPDLSAA